MAFMTDDEFIAAMAREATGRIARNAPRHAEMVIHSFLEATRSPIERALAMELAISFDCGISCHNYLGSERKDGWLVSDMRGELEEWRRSFFGLASSSNLAIVPQARITDYLVDFAILAKYWNLDNSELLIAIECDGHEFHERTKEQAKKDRARDRSLQAAGAIVLRFTGSEIYEDAYQCVAEIRRLIDSWESECLDRQLALYAAARKKQAILEAGR